MASHIFASGRYFFLTFGFGNIWELTGNLPLGYGLDLNNCADGAKGFI